MVEKFVSGGSDIQGWELSNRMLIYPRVGKSAMGIVKLALEFVALHSPCVICLRASQLTSYKFSPLAGIVISGGICIT